MRYRFILAAPPDGAKCPRPVRETPDDESQAPTARASRHQHPNMLYQQNDARIHKTREESRPVPNVRSSINPPDALNHSARTSCTVQLSFDTQLHHALSWTRYVHLGDSVAGRKSAQANVKDKQTVTPTEHHQVTITHCQPRFTPTTRGGRYQR